MTNETYNHLKTLVNQSPIPSAIMAVEKNSDGGCGEVRFAVINEAFKRSYYSK